MKQLTTPKSILATLRRTIGATEHWPGRCYEIAVAATQVGVPGKALYGHWLGPVAKDTLFEGRDRAGFVRHGWIEMPDGKICDPTRWVFEGKKPYVYIGPNDHYDMGGNAFRRATLRPPPEWDETNKQVKCDVPTAAWNFIEKILKLENLYDDPSYKIGYIDSEQLFWLANLDLMTLGSHAKDVFEFIVRNKGEAFIPCDNRKHVLG